MQVAKPNILLVDDDPAMLRLLAKWLESEGYAVRRANNGAEAIEAIKSDCPDILVTDWEMPQIDGMELCRWVRRDDLPHYVYTIFLTVRSGSNDMVCGLEAGADDFLKKPVDRGELLARIRAGTRVLELESRLSLLAKLDPLTGLVTQRTFYEDTNKEWTRSTRHLFPLSCVMLDIDFFKRINDVYGHSVGDEVIRRIATILKENCRASDIVSRYGGEEFCCLLPETDETAAALWADRVRQQIAATRFHAEEVEFSVTSSMGVAERRPDITSVTTLVEKADQALLVAKRAGRDRVMMYHALHQPGYCGAIDNREKLFAGVTAKAVMTTIVASLKEDESIGHAIRYFLRMRISSSPVTTADGKLVGILSDKDCLATMLTPGWAELPIKDIMKHNVVCYEEDTPVQQIYEFLCRVSIRTVVIVSGGVPCGVITRGSLLRWASNVFRAEHLEQNRSRTDESSLTESPRERILRTSKAIAMEGEKLARMASARGVDLMPCVVGGASRMQELVTDLLACSRYANDATDEEAYDALELVDIARGDGLQQGAVALANWMTLNSATHGS
jgi:two-component system cell cycle response regulator